MVHARALSGLALKAAEKCLAADEPAKALEWIEKLPPAARPRDLNGAIHYALGKEAARGGHWGSAEQHFRSAVESSGSGLYNDRLRCHRARGRLMEAALWESVETRVDIARRLAAGSLKPEIAGVYACGAYYSRGELRRAPWSQLLRLAKEPGDNEEHEPSVKIAGEYIARFLMRRTPIASTIDVSVAIPANPLRFVNRMMSLPDELARGIERCIGIPFLARGLRSTAKEIELRGLSWSERCAAVRGSMVCDGLGIATGRDVLVIDDVITSGATMREAARLLRQAGAREVYGLALSHTEG